LHDLLGRALGVPVYQLLGGRCRDAVPIAHMLGLLPLDDALAEARAAWADGLRAFQVKGGRDPERDREVISRLRAALGPAAFLRLDANQGYGLPKVAIAALRAMEQARLDAAEQPVAGLAALAEVRQAVRPLVIADESCWSAADALALAQACAVDAISIYVGKAGGLYPARQIAAVAAAAGLPHDVNGSLELGVGTAANVHLAIAAPMATLASVTPIAAPAETAPTQVGGRYFADDVVSCPFSYRDGAVAPLDAPGLGVTLDAAKLRRYTVAQRRSERSAVVRRG
jgi:muconate cycloisomerase